jgi:hypothetical protein
MIFQLKPQETCFMKYILVSIVLLVAGCVNPTKQVPTEEQFVEYSFNVDQNYQAVYQRILEMGRACTGAQFTAKMILQGEIYDDIKAADISVMLSGFFSASHYMTIRIDTIEQDKSRVKVSNKLPRWNNYARAVKGWVLEDSTECGDPAQHFK